MRKIVLSKRAAIRLEELLSYLNTVWSPKDEAEFIEKLDKSLFRIQKFPSSTTYSVKMKGLHRLVVTKQTTLYYKFDSKKNTIVAMFDTRMNPSRLKNELKSD